VCRVSCTALGRYMSALSDSLRVFLHGEVDHRHNLSSTAGRQGTK
jgi:hypothetical protein